MYACISFVINRKKNVEQRTTFLIGSIKEINFLAFLILAFNFDHIFGPKKEKIFFPVFVFPLHL